jgi:phage-related protein
MILDNLGIIVKIGEANEQYAQSIGKTVDEMTSAEQKQALLNAVVTSGRAEMQAMGEIQITNKERMEQMTTSLANFKDVLGAELIPYMTQFATIATEWINKFQGLDAGQKKMVVAGLALLAVLPPLLIVVGMLAQGIGALTVAVGFLISPVGLVILAVGALIAIGVLLYKNWDTIKQKAGEIWGAITGTVAGWLESMRNAITEKLNFVKLFLAEFFNLALGIVAYGVGLLIGSFKLLLDWLFPGWSEALTTVIEFVKTAMATLGSAISVAMTTIKTVMSGAWEFVKGITTNAWGFIKDDVMASIGFVAGLIQAVAEPIKQAWGAIWDGVKTMTTNAWGSIKEAVKSGINWIIDKLNWFIQQANKIAKAGNVIPGVTVPQLSQIPRLAKGGIVDSPTLAMIGEKGREAVVPLDGNTGLGNTIILNITGNQLLNERDAEKLGDAILGKLKLGLNIA